MKQIRKILIGILSVLMLFTFSMAIACDKPDPTPSGYTVTFMVEGAQYGSTQTVQRGRRVEKPADPTFATEGYVFTGWYTTQTFEEASLWNFQTGIVTDNLTLYAGYRVVNAYVQEVAKAEVKPIIKETKKEIAKTEVKPIIENIEPASLREEVQIVFKKALTDREQLVFDYFLKNKNQIVYAKDLANLLSLPRDYVYKYIKNLRAKIDGENLKNAEAGGFMLTV